MNILISGNLSYLSNALTNAFLRERYKVVLASSNAKNLNLNLPNVTSHSVSPADPLFKEIVSAYKFDIVIYLANREEQLLDTNESDSGQILDGLLNTLEICKSEGIERIFYISSTEVYGNSNDTAEQTDPQPASPNGYVLKAGERFCQLYTEQYGIHSTIIRVPFLYGEGEKASLLYHLFKNCTDKKRVPLPAGEDTIGSFLSTADVANFILRALDEDSSKFLLVNLVSASTLSFGQLAELLQVHFPNVQFTYNPAGKIFTQPANGTNAKKLFDWIAERSLETEIPEMIAAINRETRPKISFTDRIKGRFPQFPAFLKWAEVLLGALAMHFLNEFTGTLVEFRYVDFRLVYVILMGSIYGTQAGLIAALLASISIVFSWSKLNIGWAELIYNVANWLPFAVYIAAGTISGYIRDKKENDFKSQNEQNHLILEKYTFLYEMYVKVCEIKNQFHKQLVGSRDSYGRIFNITRELDTLQEEEVLLKALSILEDVMSNQNIAIYSINQEKGFARVEIFSSQMNGKTAKTLPLAEYPEMLDSTVTGEIFQNNMVLPGYPAYFAPIRNGETTVAAVVIWQAKVDQYSLYYYNLFKVICGLIESSINRVSLFMEANKDKLYLPFTRIMQPDPFGKVLTIKNTMRKNKIGDFLLVQVNGNEPANGQQNWVQLYASISSAIRAEDYVGVLSDGSCYILFSQASRKNADILYQRLDQHGLCAKPVVDINAFIKEVIESKLVFNGVKNESALP